MPKYWVLDQRNNKAIENVAADTPQQAIATAFNGNELKEVSCIGFDFATQSDSDRGYQYWSLVTG